MGTPEFARRPLACLAESKHKILAVVTGQDEPLPRGNEVRPTAVKQEALKRGLDVLTPARLKDKQLRQTLREYDPDIFVVVAFKILPRQLFTLPKYGSMNVHASLLPKYRGAAPINWALINGERETGLSSFVLDEKVDTGDLVLQEKVGISDEDNFDSLYARLSELAGPFLLKSLDLLESRDFAPIPQDHSQATPAPKITAEDALIDFGFPAKHVVNFVRGLCSVPGAYTYFRGTRVIILRCTKSQEGTGPSGESAAAPGTIIPSRKRLLVQCADSLIEIQELKPQGKTKMDGRSFLNGYRPGEGDYFGIQPERHGIEK